MWRVVQALLTNTQGLVPLPRCLHDCFSTTCGPSISLIVGFCMAAGVNPRCDHRLRRASSPPPRTACLSREISRIVRRLTFDPPSYLSTKVQYSVFFLVFFARVL